MTQQFKLLILFPILMSVISSSKSFGQESDTLKCNISIVLQMDDNIDKAPDELVAKFLKTFGQDCKNNAEYSEFSNEVLFRLLQRQPSKFCFALDSYKESIDIDYIIQEIENPLLDLIDLEKTKERIVESLNDMELKVKLQKALDIAIEKNK